MKIWHIALAVPDLEEGMAEIGEAFEITWRPVRHVNLTLTDEHGVAHAVTCKVTFSYEGNPAIELLESVPGTPLAAHPGTAFHHIGGWVDDFDGEAARYEERGWYRFGTADLSSHTVKVELRRGPYGLITELCDVTEDRPSMRDFFPPTSPFYEARSS